MNAMKPLIDQLTLMIKEGYDLGKGELPDIGKQLIRYKVASECISLVSCLAVGLIGSCWTYSWFLVVSQADQSVDGRWFGIFITGIISGGILIGALCSLDGLLKLWIAPKVFLLDCLKSYL